MNIGTLTGRIEIINAASDVLKKVAGDVGDFAEKVAPSILMAGLKMGSGLAYASTVVSALTVSIIALGDRGADINDVSDTLDHFAGSAGQAEKIMQNLRRGTMGVVDDFDLLKFSSKTLQAGVKLTEENFKTLGEAAFVLQNRGLGTTNEMLNTLSRALVTGRTRTLEMQIGVIDVTTAQKNLQRELGVDKLTSLQAAEAKRTAILEKMQKVVADAGPQQRDFGENIEYVKTSIVNFNDSLGQAIARSPAVNTAMTAMGDAIGSAFGANQKDTVDKLAYSIGEMAIVAVKAAGFVIDSAMQIAKAYYSVRTAVDTVFESFNKSRAEEQAEFVKIQEGIAKRATGDSAVRETAKLMEMRTELDRLRGVTKGFNDDANESAQMLDKVAQKQQEAAKFVQDLADKMTASQKGHLGAADAAGKHGKALDDAEGGTVALTKAQLKLQKELEKLKEQLTGIASIKAFDKLRQALGGDLDISKLTSAGQKQLKEAADAAIAGYNALGQAAPADLRKVAVELENLVKLHHSLDHMLDGLKIKYTDVYAASRSLAGAVPQVSGEAAGNRGNLFGVNTGAADWDALKAASTQTLDGIAQRAKNTYEYAKKHSDQYSEAAIANFRRLAIEADRAAQGVTGSAAKLGGELASTIIGALQGGGNPVAAVAGELGQKLGSHVAEKLSASLVEKGAGKFVKGLGDIFSGAIPVIGSLIGPLAEMLWGSLFGTKGRDAKLDAAKQMFGSVEEMQKRLVALGQSEYDRLWKMYSEVGQNNEAQAKTVMAQINAAIANSPQAQAEASGYKTTAQLEAIAKKAKETYDYMASSGQYTATVLQAAWKTYQDAQDAAIGKTADSATAVTAETQKAIDAIKAMDDEIKGLQDSIAGEAPEEYMGVVESNTRRQIDEIKNRRDVAAQALEDTVDHAAEAAKQAADVIDTALQAREYKIKVKVDLEGMPDFGNLPSGPIVGPASTVPGARGGGTAIIQLDKRTITEAIVPMIPGIVQEYNLG